MGVDEIVLLLQKGLEEFIVSGLDCVQRRMGEQK